MAVDFQKIKFVTSAVGPSGFKRDGLPQLAFAGRSNVGKSSVLNCLAGRKALARVGSSPGKTNQINYFLVEDKGYLTDLPGYGYAKVSKAERERWGKLMESYFASGLVSGGVMIVDARHKPTADDVTMAEWFQSTGCPVAVVANKLDKLKASEVEPNLLRVRQTLPLDAETKIIPFSAEKGTGRDTLRLLLGEMME